MKRVLLKFLKYVLIVVAILLLILLIFGVVLGLNWPWWMGIFLLLVLASLWIGGLFIRKILLRRRERNFVQQVIEHDEAHLKTLTGKARSDQKELQARWREAIDALKRSHLRKIGNPLYVLPWYLVIGESGSGKTTAISSARLSSPFLEVRRTPGISGTRNCDWWFFEQAIILDTAGRYAIPVDQGRDKDEWQTFLNLLARYRKKEPIHGLIVTIAADKLLQSRHEQMEEDGRTIRRRIDELMRVLGATFPVYILVTKCDLIQGMAQFCDQLPEKTLEQPMGMINQDVSPDLATFLERTIQTIGERLRNLRLLLLPRAGTKAVSPGLLLFPEEFENLKAGLEWFLKGAFQANRYQETPFLRGLFFSSGRQEGTPYSHFLNALGLIGEKDILPGTTNGLFLHDFFATILPRDKGLFAPTRRALEWGTITRNLGLTAWVLLVVSVCGLLSFSFVKNLRAIREASREYAETPAIRGEFFADLLAMDRFGQAILNVEARNRNWWVPRFGLNESIDVEEGFKRKFVMQFHEEFLSSFDEEMKIGLSRLDRSAPDEVFGQYMTHLVRRINLLKSRLEGNDYETLHSKPQPTYVTSLYLEDQEGAPELGKKFGSLYLNYLLWRPDEEEIRKETDLLQSWLKRLLSINKADPQWLAVWVDHQGTVSPVTLKDFWGGGLPLTDGPVIMPAFTRKGKDAIESFLLEVEAALPDPLEFARQKAEFENWYRSTCFEAWHRFGAEFFRGVETVQTKEEWQKLASQMTTDQNPYFAFLNHLASELATLATEEAVPLWLQQVYQFQSVKSLADTGILGEKGAEQEKGLLNKLGERFGVGKGKSPEPGLLAAKAYQKYKISLAAIAPVSTTTSQAFQTVSEAFSEDPGAAQSPFLAGYGAADLLKGYVVGENAKDPMFGNLMRGPIDFLWAYGRMETACSLQNQWEQTVLSEAHGGGEKEAQFLFGPEGPVKKFVEGPAAPFIQWSMERGFSVKERLGGTIPFEPSYLAFLEEVAKRRSALKKTSYSVSISGLPTDANPDARQLPQSTHLELQCAAGSQKLDNFQYPVSRTFQWSWGACEDVLLRIQFGNNIVLTKKYAGNEAFPDFLKDFQGGRRTFSPDDFPGEKAALERLGIRFVRVNYLFKGDLEGIRNIGMLPGMLPRTIALCWGQ